MVYKDFFQPPLPANTSQLLHPTTLTSRGTNTLNHPKTKVLHTTTTNPCPLKKLSRPIHPNPPYRKRIKQTTMALELVTPDCSSTRVTSAKHSALIQLIVEKLGLNVRSLLLKHKTTFSLAPLQCFSYNQGVQGC